MRINRLASTVISRATVRIGKRRATKPRVPAAPDAGRDSETRDV